MSNSSIIERAETAERPLAVGQIGTLMKNANNITVLELGRGLTPDRYNSPEVQRLLASSFPNLQQLKIVVNREGYVAPGSRIPQFCFTPQQYPSLATLFLDGIEIVGTDLSTIEHLALYNFPWGEAVHPLHWFSFISLLNTAKSLASLELDSYLDRVDPSVQVLAANPTMFHPRCGRHRYGLLQLPNLRNLIIREDVSGAAVLTASLALPPLPSADVWGTMIVKNHKRLRLFCTGPDYNPERDPGLAVTYVLKSGFIHMDEPSEMLEAIGCFFSNARVRHLHCTYVPEDIVAQQLLDDMSQLHWGTLLLRLGELRTMSLDQMTDGLTTGAINLFRALRAMLEETSADGRVCLYPPGLDGVVVLGPGMQHFEPMLRHR
ncbi:hypothetical protein C8Q74DRAFT_570119 [Fomes fomentarius]|nr:hypothetical protein C8Q74DRAFT_570119 [Fomes fomentarius]